MWAWQQLYWNEVETNSHCVKPLHESFSLIFDVAGKFLQYFVSYMNFLSETIMQDARTFHVLQKVFLHTSIQHANFLCKANLGYNHCLLSSNFIQEHLEFDSKQRKRTPRTSPIRSLFCPFTLPRKSVLGCKLLRKNRQNQILLNVFKAAFIVEK